MSQVGIYSKTYTATDDDDGDDDGDDGDDDDVGPDFLPRVI